MTVPARADEGSDAGADAPRRRYATPLPGQMLGGKYRIEALMAEGGMGVVLRATHLELDRIVAIKLIRPEHTENEALIARLLAEARIAASLRSKHVNHVLDVGRTEQGIPYLVLEYMEGSDLGAYLDQHGPLPVAQAVDCVMQSCEALAEAHAFGIVHRDLKPENLFLAQEADGGFVLKVLDFGISKAPASRRGCRTLTNPFELVGSPYYMAPEQIRGGQVDARADIWALGTLLYELCSCNPPFAAETVTETFSLILDPDYALPPLKLGPDAEHLQLVIERCLRREPEERYQSVVELADALSPLGSDREQGKRVAKVAVATSARVLATPAQPSAPTPDASPAGNENIEPELEGFEAAVAPRRHGGRWLAAGTVALALLGLGFRYATPPSESQRADTARTPEPTALMPAPLPARPAPATPETHEASIAPPATTPSVAPIPAISPTQPRPAPLENAAFEAGRAAARAHVSPVIAQPVIAQPVVAEPEPEPVPAAPPRAKPAPAARVTASADAWDPSTFGGRR